MTKEEVQVEILDVDYVSEWDDGFEIVTEAKFNTKTQEVFDIESTDNLIDDDGDEVQNLNREFIRIDDSIELEVKENDEGLRFTTVPYLIVKSKDDSIETQNKTESTSKTMYRAVLHNPNNGSEQIESTWYDTEEEANRAGKTGLDFYGGSHFTIEKEEKKKVYHI